MKMLYLFLLLMGIAAYPFSAFAALKNENLLVTMPSGFKQGSAAKENGVTMVEYIPTGESVEDWSKMITVQIFHSIKKADPSAFLDKLRQMWSESCRGASVYQSPGGATQENGYPANLWFFDCPINPQTQKPEHMMVKAVAGDDALYLVQYAQRKKSDKGEFPMLTEYLKKVSVCDTRTAQHPCPGLK